MKPVIVFDLDGTLVDSLPDIVASFLAAFDVVGLPPPAAADARATVGKPLEEMYAAFAPEKAVADLAAAYRQHYPRHFRDHSRPFPGVPELLEELGRRGFARAVATTKRTEMALRFVEAMGLAPLLDHVQGTDDIPHKPAPDVVLRAIEALGARGSWMVGDTVSDVQAGRAAGLRTYAVTWGTHDRDTLAGARPDALEPDLTRLLEVVA